MLNQNSKNIIFLTLQLLLFANGSDITSRTSNPYNDQNPLTLNYEQITPEMLNNAASSKNLAKLDLSRETLDLTDFSKYELSREIIEQVGTMVSLKSLHIRNRPDFSVEHFKSFEKLTNLTDLNLESTSLKRPISSDDGRQKKFKTEDIDQHFNFLTNLTNLTSLNLYYMFGHAVEDDFAESIFKIFATLPALTHLNFGFNLSKDSQTANGHAPYVTSLIQLTQLTSLSLSKNKLQSDDVELIAKNLTNLQQLDVSDNTEIGLESPVYLVKIKNLTSLNVSNCNIRTDGIEILAKLKFLRELNVSHNKLDDKKDNQPDLFHFLNKYEELRILNVSHNNINDISKFRHENITDLDLSHNNLKNFDNLIQYMKLNKLNLSHNSIEKPSTYITIKEGLEELDLSDNLLKTLIPLDILQNIRKLNLKNNSVVIKITNNKDKQLIKYKDNSKRNFSCSSSDNTYSDKDIIENQNALQTLKNITSGNNGELII